MKKVYIILIAITMSLFLVACGSSSTDSSLLAASQARVKELEGQLAEAEAKVSELEARINTIDDSSSQQEDGGAENAATNSESKVNSINDNTSKQDESVPAEDEFIQLNLGDCITLDFVDFTVDSASWSDTIKPTDTSGFYSYKPDNDNESYFWLCGTMKNTSGNAYSVEDIVSEIVFDDKYTYNAYLIADDGGDDFYGDYVKPLSTVKYYIYVSAPDEVKEIYNSATVRFGFANNFSGSYYDEFEECDYLYEVKLAK